MIIAMKYRNLSVLLVISWVLCLSPLADIHLEKNSVEEVGYVHGPTHSETNFSMFLHELLFTHLKHTLDHVIFRVSDRTGKTNKIAFSKEPALFCTQVYRDSVSQFFTVQAMNRDLIHNKCTERTYSWESSGLSPPTLFS